MSAFSTFRHDTMTRPMPNIHTNQANRRSMYSGHMRRACRVVGDVDSGFRILFEERPIPGQFYRNAEDAYRAVKDICAGRIQFERE